jgi:hypothetical protein
MADRPQRPSGEDAERLAELSSLVERLAQVIRPTYIPEWLNRSMDLLDDDKPIERIAAGDCHSVARLISGLEDPGAVQPSRVRGPFRGPQNRYPA